MPIVADIYYHAYNVDNEGRQPPIVLIHGAGGMHLHWPTEVRRLPGYRIFALDLPGHGKSPGRGRQSISAYASAVQNWMTEVGLHAAVLVGHSMGSAIALTLALDRSTHVLGLGLIGAGARLRVSPALLEDAGSQTTFYSAVATIVEWSFSPSSSRKLTEIAARRMEATRPSVLHGDLLACDGYDVLDRLTEIDQPTQIICGADDKMTPPRYSQYLADHIPHANLQIVPNAGHMVMLENPQIVAAVLTDLMNSIAY